MDDAIIIGSGPAGITAGIYLKRAGFNPLIISSINSSLNLAEKIENYYGIEKPIEGSELYKTGIKQAENIGIKIVDKEVISIKYLDNGFEIITANQGTDEEYKTKYIIIATGANRNKPDISGIDEFEGRGISYCAICDGNFYRNKDVAVLGSGEYAIGEIEELIPIVNNVTMLTNGEKPIQNRLNISINENEIEKIVGDTKIREVLFKDGTSEKVDAVFIAQGIASSIDFAKKLGAKVENNNIIVNEKMETSVENLYACGDCTGGIMQISKATYQGMVAGLEVIKKLRKDN